MLLHPNALWQRAAFIAALAVGVSGSIAVAQETGMSYSEPAPVPFASSPEVVIVTPPYRGPTRSTIGAPIQDVSLTAAVRVDDLNPQSPGDMIELRNRVWDMARRLCARLRFRHPIGTPDEFRCRRRAMESAAYPIDFFVPNDRSAPEMENP